MNVSDRDRRIITILTIFTVIFTFFGASLAYWNWESNETEKTTVEFTLTQDYSCSVDGGGEITQGDAFLAPATCTSSDHAIVREVTVSPNILKDGISIYLNLWLNVDYLDAGLSESDNFKYALTTSGTSCTSGTVLASGTFNGKTSDNKVSLINGQLYSATTTETYYLWVWLDAEETSTSTMNQNFALSLGGKCTNEIPYSEEILNGAHPELEDGMIPVTIDNNGTVRTISITDSNWYSYENKEWANAVLVKEDGTRTREYYQTNVSKNEVIPEEDILAYYVWIPRYKYRIWTVSASTSPSTIKVVFENVSTAKSTGSKLGQYLTHPAFTFGGTELNGIWVGKFETSHVSLVSSTTSNNLGCSNENCTTAGGLLIKPNVTALRYNNISNLHYAARSMVNSNTFGLTRDTNTHLIKNIEWGAVAYLSHSDYGIGREIYLNNSSSYITGRSFGTVGTSTTDDPSTYGSYTWLGQPVDTSGNIDETITDSTLGTYASTTGNVTGIYDMSGGAWEYVMLRVNANLLIPFTTLPNLKYYDTIDVNNSTFVERLGHAVDETGWYSDASTVTTSGTWVFRGGIYNRGAGAGIFELTNTNSISLHMIGSRLVATKGA